MALLLFKHRNLDYYCWARSSSGFTLSFALFLALFFAALFSVLSYFANTNTRLSSKSYSSLQAKYIAESANARALALLNSRTLPAFEEDDDDFEDDNEDFGDDDDLEEDDDEDFEEDDDDFGDDFEESILEIQPRYMNYVTEDLFYINIQTGEVVNQEQYSILVANQAKNQENRPDEATGQELDIRDLYLPLPEVNISRIGLIKIPEKTHLKPGFELEIADKVRVDIKQDSILKEYLGISFDSDYDLRKPILRSISPNYASPGDLIDIFVDGENLSANEIKFSSSDIELIQASDDAANLTVNINEEAKPGTYTITISGKKINFYIAPEFDPNFNPPQIYDIFMQDEELGLKQMTEINNNGTMKSLILRGKDLVHAAIAPVIVPDIRGINFTIKSFKNDEIVFDLDARSLPANNTFAIKLLNQGGESNSWLVNIVEKSSDENNLEPFTAIYSTRLKLLQANSLSNLPWNFDDDFDEDDPADGEVEDSAEEQEGRPEDANTTVERDFNLLNSDLETVWLLESIATVNGYTYKESSIVRRTVPKIAAPFITNTRVRFASKNFKVQGQEIAQAELNDSLSPGDTFLEFINEFPPLDADIEDENKQVLDGSAVVEDLQLDNANNRFQSQEIVNFEKDALVSVVSESNFDTVSDFAIIKEVANEAIVLEKPAFKEPHFIRDRLVQFIPAVISTESIDERSAKRYLEPEYAWLELENISGFQNLTNLLFAQIPSLNYFKRNEKNQYPGGYIADLNQSDILALGEYFDEEEFFGLNILQGERSFTKTSPLYGQGILIIDTTEGGRNPQGGTVSIDGGSKAPSQFRGLIYIIGNLEIKGSLDMQGAIIVKSPQEGATIEINSEGALAYNQLEINKLLFDLPFIVQPGTKKITKLEKHEF